MCILLNVQESETTSAFVYLYSYNCNIIQHRWSLTECAWPGCEDVMPHWMICPVFLSDTTIGAGGCSMPPVLDSRSTIGMPQTIHYIIRRWALTRSSPVKHLVSQYMYTINVDKTRVLVYGLVDNSCKCWIVQMIAHCLVESRSSDLIRILHLFLWRFSSTKYPDMVSKLNIRYHSVVLVKQ